MSDEQRKRAAELIASVERQLPRWVAWFGNELSEVDVPRADLLALVALAKEAEKLREAIRAAGFAVMETSGPWSIHDVSERGKAEEAKSLEVATRNVELEMALKPFAKGHLYAEEELSHLPELNRRPLNPYDPDRSPTVGDCKRAAELLANPEAT